MLYFFIIEFNLYPSTKVQKSRDMSFNNHELYFDLQMHNSILSLLRYSDSFPELAHLSSESTYV